MIKPEDVRQDAVMMQVFSTVNALLARVATREVGDLLRSPRYFLLTALPGSGRIRPSGGA